MCFEIDDIDTFCENLIKTIVDSGVSTKDLIEALRSLTVENTVAQIQKDHLEFFEANCEKDKLIPF